MPFRLEHTVGHCPGRLFLATSEFTKKKQVCGSAFAFVACTTPILFSSPLPLQPILSAACFALCFIYVTTKWPWDLQTLLFLGLEIPFLTLSSTPITMRFNKITSQPRPWHIQQNWTVDKKGGEWYMASCLQLEYTWSAQCSLIGHALALKAAKADINLSINKGSRSLEFSAATWYAMV